MRSRLKFFLMLIFWLLGAAHAADKKSETPIPSELNKWTPWLEAQQSQRGCPKQNDQAAVFFPFKFEN